MRAKICGIKDENTLRFLIDHKYPPEFIGFICNFPKSKRFVEIDKLKYLTNINKKNSKFVAVLVNPSEKSLKKLKILTLIFINFTMFQLIKQKLLKILIKKKL